MFNWFKQEEKKVKTKKEKKKSIVIETQTDEWEISSGCTILVSGCIPSGFMEAFGSMLARELGQNTVAFAGDNGGLFRVEGVIYPPKETK